MPRTLPERLAAGRGGSSHCTTSPGAGTSPPVAAGTFAPPPAMNLTVPAGTEMAIRINQSINVKHTVAGDRFTGEVAAPVGALERPGLPAERSRDHPPDGMLCG